MAIISSHTLNGVDGTHAGGIPVSLQSLFDKKVLFKSKTDNGGRLKKKVDPTLIYLNKYYELTFFTESYWKKKGLHVKDSQILDQIVVRFKMVNINSSYHIPVILSPNTYSLWWTGEHK